MKKRIVALIFTLVMLMSILPAAVYADAAESLPELVETEMDLSLFSKVGSGFSVDETTKSAILEGEIDDGARTDFRSLDLLNVFSQIQEEYIIQEICIEKMPVFSEPTKANAHVSSGFFMACVRNYTKDGMDYISFSIFRTDEAGNLSIALATKDEEGSNVLDTAYPLNKKLGDTFKITTAWHEDGSVELYCDDTLIQSYDITATYYGAPNSSRKNFIRLGYCSYGATGSMDVKIRINKLIRGNIPDHVHTPAEDDGDCTTAILCTSCGEVATPAMPSHKAAIANFKYATETEKGYTGDEVCYLCNHEISKGEETPMLEKVGIQSSNNSNNQGVDNGEIFVYIVIGVAVLAAAVVVVLVIRKKQKK